MNRTNKKFFTCKEMPIDKFISNLMYDKKFGYYSKNVTFGQKGDFITSPSISFLFSEMIALWIISFWQHIAKPKKINIIELGPGEGQLCKILIETFKNFPDFYKSCNIYLYEKSQKLIKLQKKNIGFDNVKWIKSIGEIKSGPIIFFGNEFFDAIPIKQYKKINNVLYEKYIKLDKNHKLKFFYKKITKKNIDELKKLNLLTNRHFIEYPKQGLKELSLIIKLIKKFNGALLLVDYGFLEQKNVDTLQSVKNHKKNELFQNLGMADISSLVDFNLLKNYFIKNKLLVNNIVSQSTFLNNMGITQRANILSDQMSFKDKSDIYYRLKRLLDAKYMGKLFKVICAYKCKKKFSLGFN
jgi:NADH dehydrogenase [ubiquinone] 1 alpha subcomplex assembly factor 7